MIVNLSHYDLDGISCPIILHNTIGLKQKFNIGYSRIDEYLNILEEFIQRNQPKEVFVTDLSFEEYQLEKLHFMSLNNKDIKFIFVDHHNYDFDYKKYKSSNLSILINNKYSSSKLLSLYLIKYRNSSITKDLYNFIRYVNGYDLWLDETKEFKIGFILNELFWFYKKDRFYSRFRNNFVLNNSDKNTYKKIVNDKNIFYDKLKESNKIFKIGNDDMFLIFADKYMSFVTLDFPDFKTYIIVNSSGRVSIRINKKLNSQEEAHNLYIEKIKEVDCVNSVGGHTNAFGVHLSNNKPKTLVDFSKRIMHITDEVLVHIGER